MKRWEHDSVRQPLLLDWVRSLVSLVWPPCCDYCRVRSDPDSPTLCPSCWEALLACIGGDYCPGCGCHASPFGLVEGRCPRCLGKPPVWDGFVRCGVYTGLLQSMILAFKNDRTELQRLFARLALEARAAAPFMTEVDLWVPVPLHWSRRWRRGYNQSYLLARHLAGSRVRVSHILKRTRRTVPQPVAATPAARARNVAGAFSIPRPDSVTGKTVCLVDDVKTTGATLAECTRELKAAGARRVYALVLAVAGPQA